MTTIAWDGKTLAVDRGGWNGRHVREYQKLSVFAKPGNGWDPGAFASTGDACFNEAMRQWIQSGGDKPQPAEAKDLNDECGLYVTNDGKAFTVTVRGVLLPCFSKKIGAGGGGHFALGCMVAGKTAEEAVQLAQAHTDCSAFGMDCWSPA